MITLCTLQLLEIDILLTILDYTIRVKLYGCGRLAPLTSGLTWPLTERSDSGSLRTCQNPAGRPIHFGPVKDPHDICTLVKHVGPAPAAVSKWSAPVNMKNRTIANYLRPSIQFCMAQVRIPYSTHEWFNMVVE